MIKDKDKSRIQSCVDHINTAVDVDPWAKELVAEMGKEILKAQLSGEGTTSDTTSDCISRRGAIDICNIVIDLWQGQLGEGALVAIKNAINELPSVQPQRTCVNCGRTANNGGWYADGRTRCPIEEHYALPKDGYCHLWEKRNVTDDDYPERREE